MNEPKRRGRPPKNTPIMPVFEGEMTSVTERQGRIPFWGDFATWVRDYVEENGDVLVSASHPLAQAEVIQTIYCGVPVNHEPRSGMTRRDGRFVAYGE